MDKGIDYGLGQTNIDPETGIRYGVIPRDDVLQAWLDSSTGDYGEPSCPKCGNSAIPIDDKQILDLDNELEAEEWEDAGRDYACLDCKFAFSSDVAYGEEPLAWILEDEDYVAVQNGDNFATDIFITKSPYYTRAQFCSPCAPGACHLEHPMPEGEKAYCFGHDWFEREVAPYPVYRVDDDSLVEPE